MNLKNTFLMMLFMGYSTISLNMLCSDEIITTDEQAMVDDSANVNRGITIKDDLDVFLATTDEINEIPDIPDSVNNAPAMKPPSPIKIWGMNAVIYLYLTYDAARTRIMAWKDSVKKQFHRSLKKPV